MTLRSTERGWFRAGRESTTKGDLVRCWIATLSTVAVCGILYEPSVKYFVPKLIIFFGVSLFCIVKARNKLGVLSGIALIIFVRLLLAVVIFGRKLWW